MAHSPSQLEFPTQALRHNWQALHRFATDRNLSLHVTQVLGCGRHGCAYQLDATDVLKVTSDGTEARFAQLMCRQPKPVPGIVRYDRVVRLEGKELGKFNDLPIYAIWRELARDVGRLVDVVKGESGERDRGEHMLWWLAEYVSSYKRASSDARRMVHQTQWSVDRLKNRIGAAWPRAHRVYSGISLSAPDLVPPAALRGLSPEEKIGVLLAHCDRIAHEMSRLHPSTKDLGEALIETTKAGLILCDVHLKNVGRHLTKDRWMVTDPGHVLSVGPDLDAQWIESL